MDLGGHMEARQREIIRVPGPREVPGPNLEAGALYQSEPKGRQAQADGGGG